MRTLIRRSQPQAADRPPPGYGRGGGGGGGIDGVDPSALIDDAPTRIATAVSIINFLSTELGGFRAVVRERDDQTRRQIDDRTREYAYLWDAPNRDEDAVPWWTRLWAHLEGFSNAYVYRRTVGIGSMRRTVGLDLLHPSRMRVEVEKSGERVWLYRPAGQNTRIKYRRDKIVHIMRLSWDGLRGVPPVTAAAAAHRIAALQDAWQTTHYRRSARPSGVVASPAEWDDPAVAEFYDAWDEQIASPHGGQGVLLLQGNAKYHPIMPATDEHMLAARKYSRESILGVYAPGIPHHLLGWASNTSNWGTGIEAQGLHLLSHVFEPRHNLVTDVLSRHLLPRALQVDWATAQFIKSDAKGLADVWAKYRQSGLGSREEGRAAIGLPAAPIPDDFWQPKNMTAIGTDGRVMNEAA